MMSFHWEKYFETGLSDVDDQHRHLVDLINALEEKLLNEKVTQDDLDPTFKELSAYTVYHFQEEERLMKTMGIDPRHTKSHIQEHKGFVEDITAMYAVSGSFHRKALEQLHRFLTHWLAYHILGSDMNTAHQITAIESGTDPRTAYDRMVQERNRTTEPLLAAIDGLFKLVTQRNKALNSLNQSLEKKVEERTREIHKAYQDLEIIALTDALTGLPNRRHGLQRFSTLWNESVENQTPLSCMMIDADHFKAVNDTHGHDAGDRVLRELARTLSHGIRTDDIVCRLGGDEFLIICPKTDKAGSLHLGENLRKSVAELRIPTGDGHWLGSISVGVASRSPGMESFDVLIKAADQGVYAAKKEGKNCVRPLLNSG